MGWGALRLLFWNNITELDLGGAPALDGCILAQNLCQSHAGMVTVRTFPMEIWRIQWWSCTFECSTIVANIAWFPVTLHRAAGRQRVVSVRCSAPSATRCPLMLLRSPLACDSQSQPPFGVVGLPPADQEPTSFPALLATNLNWLTNHRWVTVEYNILDLYISLVNWS